MPSATTICSIALIASCISMLAAPIFAHDLPGGGLGGFRGGPSGPGGRLGGLGGGFGGQWGGLGDPLGGLGNGQCLASLNGVHGCVQDVLVSILTLQFRLIGPACCQAIVNIDDNCWPKVLPVSPIFPLINYCTEIVPRFPQPTPPTV
ncbi:unnamed protein product [Ilex paraguariensis]|uniref:Prolamin-like domain-containing protein n=1 Tax=Ilex paraguariensis TaxID=185542 RepID=A0ABC8UJ95_9AQUA